jgi:hypothetical protein
MVAEKDWCASTDQDQFRHVWQGDFRTATEAQILRGKYFSEMFEVDPRWAGPYYGADFGFSQDPTAGTMCYIDDEQRVLYIRAEYWRLGADIDRLPADLEHALPGASTHKTYCDSARPETISYLARHGIPGAVAAEKWSGSIFDGISFLRSFAKIVIHPSCTHTLDEAARYSYKVDRLTGDALPDPEDRHNHCIDSIRYALSPIIRNQRTGGYFDRAALLVCGEPVEPTTRAAGPKRVFATVATCDRPGAAIGVVYFAHSPRYGVPVTVLDYSLFEVDELRPELVAAVIARGLELIDEWNAIDSVFRVWAEEGELYAALAAAFLAHLDGDDVVLRAGMRPPYDLARVESRRLASPDGKRLLVTLEERANDLRTAVNQGQMVKVARTAYERQIMHRSSKTNHLVSQLIGYRPDADAAHELVAAFALGVLATRVPGAPAAMPATAELPVPAAPDDMPAAPPRGPWRGFRIA